MSRPGRTENETGSKDFNGEHDYRRDPMKSDRQLMRAPRQRRRQRLRLVVKAQRGELAPGCITAAKFDDAGRKHEPKQKPPKQPENDAWRRNGGWHARNDLQWREKNCEEAHFEQQ